jgi:hypothetical protein
MPSRQKPEWIGHLTAAKLANTQELTLMKTNQHSLIPYMKPVNAIPTANPGTHLPGEKPNNPQKQGGKNPNRREHNKTISHTSHKQQITRTPKTQDNAAEGTDAADGTNATGGTSGLVRHDTPGRVFAHLPRQWRNTQVLHQPPKHMGPNPLHMRQRVPHRLAPEPLKINEQQQRGIQDICRKPYSPYAFRMYRHTSGTHEKTLADTPLWTTMHPHPD